MKRSLPMAVALSAILALPMAGLDTLQPVTRELFTQSGGNVWFLLQLAAPGIQGTLPWKILPPLAFLAAFAALFVAFWRQREVPPEARFDTAAALIAATNLLFMLLSRKSYTFYAAMFLLLAVHALARDDRSLLRHLPALVWLGASTTLEVDLADRWKAAPGDPVLTGLLAGVDLLVALAYVDLLAGSMRAALARPIPARAGATG